MFILVHARPLLSGYYIIPKNTSLFHVVRIFWKKRLAMEKIYIPEGSSNAQIAEILNSNKALSGIITNFPPEGALIAGTYMFAKSIDRNVVVKHITNHAKSIQDRIWAKYTATHGRDQVVIRFMEGNYQNKMKREWMWDVIRIDKQKTMRDTHFDIGDHFQNKQDIVTNNYYKWIALDSIDKDILQILLSVQRKALLKNTGIIYGTEQLKIRTNSRTSQVTKTVNNNEKLELQIKNGKSMLISKREWIIIASILEKEGVDLEDKRKIASVILNRLKKKMRLQIDACLIYAKTSGKYNDKIKWNEIQKKKFNNGVDYNSRYNTYTFVGLPPGPITNPGAESLVAAASPAQTNFFFYRVVNGKHVFYENFAAHRSKRVAE
jgi:cell division protein YceG involved in septum cleavage